VKIDARDQVNTVAGDGDGDGVGRALSRATRDVGAKSWLIDLFEDGGQAPESQMMQRGGTALFVSAHVSKQQDVQAYAKVAVAT
jgi:hypothetical protein